jgi:hypothetical protein
MFPGSEEVALAIGIIPYGVLIGEMTTSVWGGVIGYLSLLGALLYCLKKERRWRCYGAAALLSLLLGWAASYIF